MSQLKLIPLGGMGKVTQNMFVYEYENEILLVDCGIGFPDTYMPGVDAIIPDISYLLAALKKGKTIVGLILSHGHDDHIAATGYILPNLSDFPIFASPLTAGFAHQRMGDKGADRDITVIDDQNWVQVSTHFAFKLIPVTHSVPDTRHIVIKTPEGLIYHGSDYKIDPDPVDGVKSDLAAIGALAKENVLCMLLDCLRVEREKPAPSESTVGSHLLESMANVKGKILVTLMSSHLHRIQQVVDITHKMGRKLVFIGRSVEQNIRIARELGKINIPKNLLINKRYLNDYPTRELVVIIAGSQGQEGSSLTRAVYGEHRIIQITPQDRVIFSANVIPGNEIPYYDAIDELSKNGIEVIYPAIKEGIHQSGHASAAEQSQIVNLIKAKYVMPIGGANRHRSLFSVRVAQPAGYDKHHILVPDTGEVLAFENGSCRVAETIKLYPKIVDGLGIGDVGPVVLSDRRTLSQAGMVVVIIPRISLGKGKKAIQKLDLNNIQIVSRGFVFMKHADEVVDFLKEKTQEIIRAEGKKANDEQIKKAIERKLAKKLYKVIEREPMIVPVIMDV